MVILFCINSEMYIRASSKGQPFTIREVRASNIGQLVKISGIVTRCSDVKPLMKVAVYTCEECGFEIYQVCNHFTLHPLLEHSLGSNIAYISFNLYETGSNGSSVHASV